MGGMALPKFLYYYWAIIIRVLQCYIGWATMTMTLLLNGGICNFHLFKNPTVFQDTLHTAYF